MEEILSKFDDGKPSPDKERTTWLRFTEAERSCYEANQRLWRCGDTSPFANEISLAAKFASMILGPFSWDKAATFFAFGPGASTRLSRRKSDAVYKYAGIPHTTNRNAGLAHAAIRWNPLWERSLSPVGGEGTFGWCKLVRGNRIVTVPKNYKTDRTIAIEPCMNMYIQKGIGGLIRKRLKLAGCDLDDQTRNQRLAQVGSISGLLATVDLSMASDTVSRQLVKALIRPDWHEALEQSRCEFGVLPSGEEIFYQKFSSMGNGYTFELESLIFYSLALAYCSIHGEEAHRVSVYGDDIILPSSAVSGFSELISFLGFTPNGKKTFSSGPFRESCGKHYYLGQDVTPFYVRSEGRLLSDLFLLHNKLYRWIDRVSGVLDADQINRLHDLCRWLRHFAPSKWRKPRIPDGFGDGAFIGSFDECLPERSAHGWECFDVKVLITRTEYDLQIDHFSLLVKSLLNIRRTPIPGLVNLDLAGALSVFPARGTRARVGVIHIPLGRYASLSPWL